LSSSCIKSEASASPFYEWIRLSVEKTIGKAQAEWFESTKLLPQRLLRGGTDSRSPDEGKIGLFFACNKCLFIIMIEPLRTTMKFLLPK